jgi:plasmid stabilization system protein ParE
VTYSLHPEAEKELVEAFAFYKEQASNAVARAFLREFGRVANLLVANPGFGTPTGGGRRSYPLRHFPYSLIYRPTENGIRILVVGHQQRRPGYWRGRIKVQDAGNGDT